MTKSAKRLSKIPFETRRMDIVMEAINSSKRGGTNKHVH